MIELGLTRIQSLLAALGNPQNSFMAIHIVGTNGKGSVCAYLASILAQNKMSVGRFTSPHLIHEYDAIWVRNQPVSSSNYNSARSVIERVNKERGICATEFEKQTATAFEIFREHNVSTAVIEAGLGGKLDATNVFNDNNVICVALTIIALDHVAHLGRTIKEITENKAGIIKPHTPCFVDGRNKSEVLDIVVKRARESSSPLIVVQGLPDWIPKSNLLEGDFQVQNAAIAVAIVTTLFPEIPKSAISQGIQNTVWPGRMQWIVRDNARFLIDGAHNVSAAKELKKYVMHNLRPGPVKWVLAFSKPCDEIIPILIEASDSVVATSFGNVEGMPWVKCQDPTQIIAIAKKYTEKICTADSIEKINFDNRTIVCGSLYLIGELLKIVQNTSGRSNSQ